MSRLPDKAVARLRGMNSEQTGRGTTTWQAVRNEVLSRIRSEEWGPGMLIPTEKELAHDWGCARATVNRALQDLADHGIVERRRKVGTRVKLKPTLQASREISAIRNDIRALGSTFGYRLLQNERLGAPAEIARRLHVQTGEKVRFVNALFLADDQPYCCEAAWLNISALPRLDGAEVADGSAQEWLEHVVNPSHSRIAITARPITGLSADALAVENGTRVLTIERTDWSDHTPLAFSRKFFPPDHQLVYED